jgi:hypothetical protein
MLKYMENDFDKKLSEAKALHKKLMAMTPVTRDNLGTCNYPGVYLFTEKRRHLYCGRTKRPLKVRLLEHSRPSVKDAPFAFRLARKATGNHTASYKQDEKSRKELMKNPVFVAAFRKQKERIAKMSIRYVQADDPVTQALLEIYTATMLKTPYNDFGTS